MKLKLRTTKNKTLYILAGLAAFVVFIVMNIKKEITFSEYAKTKVENKVIDFGVAKLGDTIKQVYAIENISDKHFVISELRSDKDIFFEGTILDKSNFPGQKKSIYVQFIPETEGRISRQIEVISNSASGIIKLELKGRIE